ncbi:MAG: hypothetical protein ABW298_15805 [Candidatus Binatia bacterium]
MTPEPCDLLRGARRTLEEIVLPALADRFAIEQAKTVLRVLAHLEAVVDDAYPLEWAEARDLEAFLAAANGNADRSAPEPTALPSYRQLRDDNVRSKERVADLVRGPLRARNDPALLEAFEALVRDQLERERRWTSPKRPAK